MKEKYKKTDRRSLSEVHGSVKTDVRGNFWKRLFVFLGPAYLVSVGYMDPGNWATDLAGGSRFGYDLLWVLLMSNLIALLLQSMCARLGVVAQRDLAQASRELYHPAANIFNYILAEIAIAATDLAEVVGMAIGLQLLFDIPLTWGMAISVLDAFLILFLMHLGIRRLEAFILALVIIIGGAFGIQMFLAEPDLGEMAMGFVPSMPNNEALFIAIGIIGATVMPHNLYLHSALVQSRKIDRSKDGIRKAIKYNIFDSAIALNLALFVNAAILILAAAVFHKHGYDGVSEIQDAHKLLEPLLGKSYAPILFAIALIAAGQSSTVTGTLAPENCPLAPASDHQAAGRDPGHSGDHLYGRRRNRRYAGLESGNIKYAIRLCGDPAAAFCERSKQDGRFCHRFLGQAWRLGKRAGNCGAQCETGHR